MGIWRFAGAFAVVERQSECGSNTYQKHVSQPMSLRRVLGVVINFLFQAYLINILRKRLKYDI